jgi:hypothetical protein
MNIERATFERSFYIGPGFDIQPWRLIDCFIPSDSPGPHCPCLANLLEMKEICL